MAAALAARGFPPEERPWHPHLTIGRVLDERRWRREAGPPLRGALAQAATTTFGTQRVAEVALMRSDLSPTGARYTLRRAVRLGALLALVALDAVFAQGAPGVAPRTSLDCLESHPVETYISSTYPTRDIDRLSARSHTRFVDFDRDAPVSWGNLLSYPPFFVYLSDPVTGPFHA